MADSILPDIRYALRSLRRTPGFTLAALITLALGIGANTAIFSVLNAVVLRPLPYGDPDRVVGVWNSWDDTPRAALSAAEYFDYRDQIGEFEHLGVYTANVRTLTDSGEPVRVRVGALSYGVLPALGTAPALGRSFAPDEDRPGRNRVVLLGEGLWQDRFGAAPDVVGGTILLNGVAHTVIGVMPRGFRLPADFNSDVPAQLFVPLGLDRAAPGGRTIHFLAAVARLRPGIDRDQAAARIAAVAGRFSIDLPGQYPKAMRFSATVTSLHDDIVGDVRPLLLVLLGAIGFVLLIACANITNLFLSRSERRQQEFAVRTALGAARIDLVRQTLTETFVLALAGGALGLLVATAGVRALVALAPADLPRMDAVRLDTGVFMFAAAASLIVGVLVGLLPALRSASVAVSSVLHGAARALTGGPTHHHLRRALVVIEVALAIVLLLGAGLMARSFNRLLAVDPGYRTDHLLTASIALPPSAYPDGARTSQFFTTLLDRLRAQRSVVAAGAVASLPLTSERGDLNFQIAGRETPPGTLSRRADWQVVTPGYFQAMGMRIVRGRDIQASDIEGSPGVIVFNESAARLHWPNGDALGARLTLGGNAGPGQVTVVGIVNDIRHGSLRATPQPEMYLAHTQFRMFGGQQDPLRGLTVVVRSADDPTALAGTLRREVAALDSNIPVATMRTMEEVRSESVSTTEFVLLLLSAFAAVALTVALVGVYGVMAYAVAQRRREIGLRVALGANPARVVAMILGQGFSPAAAGIVSGLAGGFALTRFLQAQLYEVGAHDPLTAAGVSVLVAVIAFLACLLPARVAARVDPAVALRAE